LAKAQEAQQAMDLAEALQAQKASDLAKAQQDAAKALQAQKASDLAKAQQDAARALEAQKALDLAKEQQDEETAAQAVKDAATLLAAQQAEASQRAKDTATALAEAQVMLQQAKDVAEAQAAEQLVREATAAQVRATEIEALLAGIADLRRKIAEDEAALVLQKRSNEDENVKKDAELLKLKEQIVETERGFWTKSYKYLKSFLVTSTPVKAEESAPSSSWNPWFASLFKATDWDPADDRESVGSKISAYGQQLCDKLAVTGESVMQPNLSQRQDGLMLAVAYAFVYIIVNFVARTHHSSVKITNKLRNGKHGITGGKTLVTLNAAADSPFCMREMKVISREPGSSIATVGHGFLTWAHPFLAWVAFFFYSKVTRFNKTASWYENLQSFLGAEDLFGVFSHCSSKC